LHEIMTAIDIAASPERVWRVLTNFGEYSTWNPFIRAVQAGRLEPGAKLLVRMRMPPGGRAYVFRPTVLKVIPAAELRWRGSLWVKGLFDGEHIFIIVPQGLEGSRFIHRERFTGLLTPLLFRFINKNAQKSFEKMNRALKKVAEH